MTLRSDLLDLSVDALTALANAGFVKRAQKDLVEGKAPGIEQLDDMTVIARYSDGTVTRLPPARTLREAICTCTASGLCRHRVTLVLAYQAWARVDGTVDEAGIARWCPSSLAREVETLPGTTLNYARQLAASKPVVRLTAWRDDARAPTARLPMCDVRFFSPNSLALARCDCSLGAQCAHVALAVWAFAQASERQPGFVEATVELAHGDLAYQDVGDFASVEEAVNVLVSQLWLDGTSQDSLNVDIPFQDALRRAQAPGWTWVAEGIVQLRQAIQDQHARSSHATPERLLDLVVLLVARLTAARTAHEMAQGGSMPPLPARQILGIGVTGEIALDHLKLVPLGATIWSEDAAQGVQLVWVDPDTHAQTVMERRWPADDKMRLRDRRLIGAPIHKLACSQIVTRSARRRANGLLEVGARKIDTSLMPLGPAGWDQLGSPIRQADLKALREWLSGRQPEFVRPPQATLDVYVVPIRRVARQGWDAASQTLSAELIVSEGTLEDTLYLQLKHHALSPHAIDALAHALAGSMGAPIAVSGNLRLRKGVLWITPLAVLTPQGLVVPQLADSVPAHTLDGVGVSPSGALHDLIDDCITQLAQCLRVGLRHQGQVAVNRMRERAGMLRKLGLERSADAVEALLAVHDDATQLPLRLAKLHALLRLLHE